MILNREKLNAFLPRLETRQEYLFLTTVTLHSTENSCQCTWQGKQYTHWRGKSEIATVYRCKNPKEFAQKLLEHL